jgi:hypothetical protein
MNVPLLDLRRQNEPIRDELLDAFRRVLDSGQFILGKEVEQFESAAAAVAGARFAIGVTSGTDALLLALMALGIGPGDEVVCPSFTFFATAGSVSRFRAWAPARYSWIRWTTLSTSTRPAWSASSLHAPAPSFPFTCSARPPTWTKSPRSPPAIACLSSRM